MAFESESTWRSRLRRGSRVDTGGLRRGRKRGAPRHPKVGGVRVGLGSAPKPGRVACYPPPTREPAPPPISTRRPPASPHLSLGTGPWRAVPSPLRVWHLWGQLGTPGPSSPCPPCLETGADQGRRVAGAGAGGRGFVPSADLLGRRWLPGQRVGARGSRGSGGWIALARSLSLSLSLSLAAPSGSQSASAAAARGAARGGRSHIRRRRRPPTSPSDSAAPGGFEFWLPGKGPFLGERGLSFVRLRPLRAPLQAPPRPACARDCASALTAPFICLWSRRAAPEAGDPAVSCSRGRRRARMTRR